MSIAPECQRLLDQIATSQSDAERALQQLKAAGPGDTTGLLPQLRAAAKKLDDLQNALADCLADAYQLKITLLGRATVTIEGLGQGASDVSYLFLLNRSRTVITLASFPPISFTLHTPVGDKTVTITQTSGGSGTYADGKIALPLGLHLGAGAPFEADLNLTLTTDPPGSPVNPQTFGPVTLVGSGIIQGGVIIGGKRCDLTVAGTITVVAS